jgi:putative transposase
MHRAAGNVASKHMPHSLSKVLVHFVFSTKHRQPLLRDPAIRGELHAYIIAMLRELDSPSLQCNSVDDHLHLLCLLSRKVTIAKLVEEIKTSTSRWIKTKGESYRDFFWQSG